MGKKALELPHVDANAAQAECVQSLLKDRDYWQKMASQVQNEMHKGIPLVQLSLQKEAADTRSTSHQSSDGSALSEEGRNAEVTWSDSSTESTRSTAEVGSNH